MSKASRVLFTLVCIVPSELCVRVCGHGEALVVGICVYLVVTFPLIGAADLLGITNFLHHSGH